MVPGEGFVRLGKRILEGYRKVLRVEVEVKGYEHAVTSLPNAWVPCLLVL